MLKKGIHELEQLQMLFCTALRHDQQARAGAHPLQRATSVTPEDPTNTSTYCPVTVEPAGAVESMHADALKDHTVPFRYVCNSSFVSPSSKDRYAK